MTSAAALRRAEQQTAYQLGNLWLSCTKEASSQFGRERPWHPLMRIYILKRRAGHERPQQSVLDPYGQRIVSDAVHALQPDLLNRERGGF
jgi:hypothetical protein